MSLQLVIDSKRQLMTEIFDNIVKRKLQLFFLFYIVLVLPLLAFSAQNLSLAEVFPLLLVNVVLFIVFAILLAFCSSRVEKTIYFVLYFIALVPGLIYISYLLFAKVLLQENSIISLFETNPEESREFIVHYFSKWLILGQSLYIIICILMIWKMKPFSKLSINKHKKVFLGSLICLCVLFFVPYLSKQIYFVDFYKLFVDYKLRLSYEEKTILARQSEAYEVKNLDVDTLPKTIVVVIGESLTRTHMSLYGYGRDTNPKLTRLGDSLIVYKDVVSPQVHTIPVIRSVLTLADRDTPDNVTEKPSMFELFNRAGYDTYFISNQPFGGKVKTSFDSFLNLAKYKYNVSTEKQPDESVLPVLDDILHKKDSKKKLILIHLIGNHMAYEFRYTPSFSYFENKDDNFITDATFRNEKAKKTIDRYDNSVMYNDFVISEIVKRLNNDTRGNTGLIYFSDHGEEVFENRDFDGHAYEKVSSSMCEIPFLVWLSDYYKTKRTDLVLDPNRPFSTDDLLYSLSDFANLAYPDYDDSRSVFSEHFKVKQRYVGDLTYEEVKAKKIK